MMTSNKTETKVSFGFRCQEELLQSLDAYAAERGCASRDAAIDYMCKRFSAEPEYYSTYEVLDLRKPANMSLFLTVSRETNDYVRKEADRLGWTVAAVLRNIIFCEIKRAGDNNEREDGSPGQ